MAWLALGLYLIYLLSAFVARSILQYRRTGSTGFRGVSGRPGSAEWFGGVLFIVALVLGVAAPVLDLAGVVEPAGAVDGRFAHGLGGVLAAAGIILTLASQGAMGRSWRIGVDADERTALVTSGLFSVVRNPVFSAMSMTGAGLALLVPNIVALLGIAALLTALELQTRVVEEPYLLRTHGERYARYASRVGRFVPGLGLLRTEPTRRA